MTENEVRLECLKLVTANNTFPWHPEKTVESARVYAEFVLDPDCCKED